jgi:uncharacterized protein YbjT (DUF2867 family)
LSETILRTVTVFGGTGFLGRRIVSRLLDHGFAVRIAARHPARSRGIFAGEAARLESVQADINDEASVATAVRGAFAAINAVSLYVEHGADTFHAMHVEAAARLARCARAAQVERLVHVSGIGADAASGSSYIRSRGAGEQAVRAAFPSATIVRPAVLFGPDDVFLATLVRLLRTLPVFPMFGGGQTSVQPVHVEDAGEAIARIAAAPAPAAFYELGGPRVYRYDDLLRAVGSELGIKPMLVPVPFWIWKMLAFGAETLPHPPLTRNQVELMAIDTVAAPNLPGLQALGIEPRGIETVLAAAT